MHIHHPLVRVRFLVGLLALSAVAFGTVPDSFSPENPGTTAPKAIRCKVWDYGYFTGVQDGFDWGKWYYDNFPEDCDYDSNGVLKCYWGDRNEACAAWVLYKKQEDRNNGGTGTYKHVYIVEKLKKSSYACRFRVNGVLDSEETDVSTSGAPLQMQDHCKLKHSGPYSNCSNFRPGPKTKDHPYGKYPGSEFSPKQKTLIKKLNKAKNGRELKSDVNEGAIAGFTSTCRQGKLKDPNRAGANDPCIAEVHHIVPKKDTQGCACGTNSYKNAILISRELNNWIRSNPQKAQKIIDLLPLPFYSDMDTCKPPLASMNFLPHELFGWGLMSADFTWQLFAGELGEDRLFYEGGE